MPSVFKKTAIALILQLISTSAGACSPVFHQPPSQAEIFQTSEVVLLGKVVAVAPGLPADFKPAKPEILAEKRRQARRLDIDSIGQTITLAVERLYKGPESEKVTVLDQAERRINSCDVAYDWQVGDRVTVFANHDGNYITLPPMLDDRHIYSQFDPTVRYGAIKPDHPYAKAIGEEAELFKNILQALPK
ncbi:MAG: hypothetical protein KBA75_00955 [Alphaproteobacteria bacterium]|nr:hypothetical protein [Alphaproteobacteria bacterium]